MESLQSWDDDMMESDIREIIMRRPILFAELIRSLGNVPEDELTALVRKVRTREW